METSNHVLYIKWFTLNILNETIIKLKEVHERHQRKDDERLRKNDGK